VKKTTPEIGFSVSRVILDGNEVWSAEFP
jgi:hypothetical protein